MHGIDFCQVSTEGPPCSHLNSPHWVQPSCDLEQPRDWGGTRRPSNRRPSNTRHSSVPQGSSVVTSPGSVWNPRMLFWRPVSDGQCKRGGKERSEGRGEERVKTGDKGKMNRRHLETRIPFLLPPCNTQTHTATGNSLCSGQREAAHSSHAWPARPPHHSHQALTRIWFRSCSASCLSCSSSLMAPGPWGGVGGGWGPRDGGWGRQLLAAGPRPGWGGNARLTSGPKTAREAAGKGGVEAHGQERVCWAGGAEDVVPGEGSGSPAPERRCQGTNDFPNLPPGPPETKWEVQEEEQGKPLPRTAARAGHSGGRNWGWGGGESLRKQTWRPPQPAQGAALPAPNFKKGRCLFKFTPTHRTPSTHTPS